MFLEEEVGGGGERGDICYNLLPRDVQGKEILKKSFP
jgi:hypothetical protein